MAHEAGKTVARGRPRGLRGHRLRPLLRRRGAAARRASTAPSAAPLGVVVVVAAVELPATPSRRRRARRAGRRQRRHPQAGARDGRARRCAGRRAVLGGRRATATCCSSCRAPTTTSADGWSPTPSRRGRAHRRRGTRPAVPRLAARPAPARRDERQERDRRSRRAPTSTSPIARPRALGVRPRRPEVLGGQPRDRRRRRCTTTPRFRRQLADAVAQPRASARPTDPATEMGPLIRPPAGRCAAPSPTSTRASVARRAAPDRRPTATLWSPGRAARRAARVVVPPAPSASVRCSGSCAPTTSTTRSPCQNAAAVRAHRAASTARRRESSAGCERVEVGNAYVNRAHHRRDRAPPAVRRVEALGGRPGAKAGGPDHVASLGRWRTTGGRRATSPPRPTGPWWEAHATGHDPTGLRAERNELRYRPLRRVLLRAADERRRSPTRCGDGRRGDRRRAGRAVDAAPAAGARRGPGRGGRRGARRRWAGDGDRSASTASAVLGAATPALLAAMHTAGRGGRHDGGDRRRPARARPLEPGAGGQRDVAPSRSRAGRDLRIARARTHRTQASRICGIVVALCTSDRRRDEAGSELEGYDNDRASRHPSFRSPHRRLLRSGAESRPAGPLAHRDLPSAAPARPSTGASPWLASRARSASTTA